MARLSLTKRLWLSFVLLIIIVALIVGLVYPFSLQQALKQDTYHTIEQQQAAVIDTWLNGGSTINNFQGSGIGVIQRQQAARSVGHLLVYQGLQDMQGDPVPLNVYDKMVKEAEDQDTITKKHDLDYQGTTLYYVIRKLKNEPDGAYLISYMWGTYANQMVKNLWSRLIIVLVFAGFVSLILVAWLTRYLKGPLKLLGRRFEEISKQNFRKPFEWKTEDEFGRLSEQFEKMRRNLLQYDEAQKQFLQRASHELKTPIMVIQSYAQSVKDGIYPTDKLDDTMDVIMDEAELMERRVKKLLYFTRVDSLRDEEPNRTEIRFGDLTHIIKERLAGQRTDVAIEIENGDTMLYIDEEQWLIVLENLVENALRYAKSWIKLKAFKEKGQVTVYVENNGEPIPEDDLQGLFEPFSKGKKGQFGLGLAIVKRIIDRHDGMISVQNTEEGVRFTIRMPLKSHHE
ncbi:ATP-binding protein [Camelliibacillus cellulosilyticus]|uniref:histidine kinase n=1 Tax=Camelliibacillus cellulosilyticus TaxID=2174486 RepID=A0ABV9GQ64_9BACL